LRWAPPFYSASRVTSDFVVALPKRCAAVIAVLALAACGTPQPAAQPVPTPPAPSPSPASSSKPAVGPLALLVQRAGAGEPYVVQLLRPDGRALPAVHAMARAAKTYFPPASPCPAAGCASDTANYQLPETAISSTKVYFLDGEADLKSLSPAGAVTLVRHLDVPANSNVSFAVSPDDRRLAVAQLTYGAAGATPAFSLRLYVENLADGKNRIDLFTSNTVAEWPVGWHGGRLVLAVGRPGVFTRFNPYGAVEYHLIDPDNGTRLDTIGCSFGPLVAGGSACWTPGVLGRQDWTEATTHFRLDPAGAVSQVQESYVALSPDGSRVAAAVRASSAASNTAELFAHGSEASLAPNAAPLGWLDADHVLLLTSTGLALADVAGKSVTPVTGLSTLPGQGLPSFLGILPAALG
jgi:hypothetical protein